MTQFHNRPMLGRPRRMASALLGRQSVADGGDVPGGNPGVVNENSGSSGPAGPDGSEGSMTLV